MSADNANTETPSQPRELGPLQREYTGEMDERLHESAAAVYEIEVTPKMIESGIDILMDFELGWSDPKVFAANIYRAMAFAACRDGGSASARSR